MFTVFFIGTSNHKAAAATTKETGELQTKLYTAVSRQAAGLNITVSDYSASKYSADAIDRIAAECEVKNLTEHGYIFGYDYTVKADKKTATFQFNFYYKYHPDYIDASVITTEKQMKALLKDATDSKKKELTIVKYDYKGISENDLIKSYNTLELYEKGYKISMLGGSININPYVSIIDVNLSYDPVDFKSLMVISSYEELCEYIQDSTERQLYHLDFVITDYSPQKFYPGEAFYKVDSELAVERGYYTDYVNCFESNAKDVIFKYLLNYSSCTSEEDLKADGIIIKSSGEWWNRSMECLRSNTADLGVNLLYSYPYKNESQYALVSHPEYDYEHDVTLPNHSVAYKSSYSPEQISEMETAVNKKVIAIIKKIIKKDMTDKEKAKAIHDYLITNCKFDYKNSLNYTIPAEDYTAYGVLIKKIGVGRGYSAAFNLLAAEAGIKSIAVSGEVISAGASIHTWNYACLDGKYVYIDCAMDDPGFKGNDNSKDIYTSYFAVPAKALMVRHEWVADGLKDYLKY